MPQFNDQIPFPVKDPSAEILADTLIEIGRRTIRLQDDLDFAQIREDQLKADLKRSEDNLHGQAAKVKTLEAENLKLRANKETLEEGLKYIKQEHEDAVNDYKKLDEEYTAMMKKYRRLERQVKKLTRKK